MSKKQKKTSGRSSAKKSEGHGILPGQWFALLNHPADLPVLFTSRQDAEDNQDADEYLVEVYVHAARLSDVSKARLWEQQQKPRSKAEEKRRAKIRLHGTGMLRAALTKFVPELRRRVQTEIDKSIMVGQRSRPRIPDEQKRRRGSK